MSTNEYIKNWEINDWTLFNARFWQQSFYDHIIRNEDDLVRMREYIENNPLNWEKDEYYEAPDKPKEPD